MSVSINARTRVPNDIAVQLVDGGYFPLWTIGVILSAIVYGGALFLAVSYVHLLKTSNNISRRMRNFLLIYVTFMVANSTIYMITITIALVHTFSELGNPLYSATTVYYFENGFLGALSTTLASWGADGFMLWRCAVLYEGISRGRRIALIVGLVSIALLSLGCGLTYLIHTGSTSNLITASFFLAIIGVTIILNLITATLITLRILYFDRYIRKTTGAQHNSPYTTIIAICVESSALIIFFGLICLILLLRLSTMGSTIPMQMLVHIYVISPLLIVYRVARGRAVTTRQRPAEIMSELRFGSQVLSSDRGV